MEAPYEPGSDADFDRLYRNSHNRILRTMTSVLRDASVAEDCTQDAFVRAYHAWPRWKPDAPAEAWLHRIAINVAMSYRRREAVRALGRLLHITGAAVPGTEQGDAVSASDLLSALRRLPPRQAAALVLRHHHGYSNKEIAQALGVPESTIASRLAAAKERLRAELGDDGQAVRQVLGTQDR